jgi:hypothetical protein
MRKRSHYLADRLEHGARELLAFANGLTPAQWSARLPGDGRSVGTVVHHVASVYPIEVSLAQKVAAGDAIVGVYMANIHDMNAGHAAENPLPSKGATIELLARNSAAAALAIRELSDAELDRAQPASLYADAPLTAQFILEDHAVRHSYHHLAGIRRAVESLEPVAV